MYLKEVLFSILVCILLLSSVEARRIKLRQRPIQKPVESQEEDDEIIGTVEKDSREQSNIQYFKTENVQLDQSDEDYNEYYNQPSSPNLRPRVDFNRPIASNDRFNPPSHRSKDNSSSKSPPVQTIRNYNKVNDDGSFTFGYEAADGSFKEETRGTDCVVRGKYGYIDPDGNKREFTYVSGNPCDPNNPDEMESDEILSSENDSKELENVSQNYPSQRPVRPTHTTTHAPKTVFQNTYAHHSLQIDNEEEHPEPIQVLQPQKSRTAISVQPLQPQFKNSSPSEVTIRQKPRLTVSTTPTAVTEYRGNQAVSITPRITFQPTKQKFQAHPPATTYRPVLHHQQPTTAIHSKSTASPSTFLQTHNSIPISSRRPIDFTAEFQKFQKENKIPTTTLRTTTAQNRPQHIAQIQFAKGELPPTSNPIYESQLIYDTSSGQYDSTLYQQLPQTDGEFQLNHQISPFVHQTRNTSPFTQLFSSDQLQQVNPIYRRQQAPLTQFSQKIYEKERENLQVLNSQQLFQQQQQLQNQQLQQDRIDAAKKATVIHQQHRFKPSQLLQHEPDQFETQIPQQQQQGFYFIQPSGQIDSFLRGHNINF